MRKKRRQYQFWGRFGKGFGRVWEGLEGIKIRWEKSFNIRGRGARVPIAALGRNLYRGGLLAGLGRLLREFRAPETSKTSILEGLGTSQARFSRVWGPQFDILFAAHCALLPHVFLGAVATLLHLPSLFLLPFWCGGLCAAHGIHRTARRCPGVSDQ